MSRAGILVVDDDAIGMVDLRDRLDRLGYAVNGICSGVEEALRKIPSLSVDLVLINIDLKGRFDGVDAAKQIREQFKVAVVYLVSRDDPDAFRRAHIVKPLGYLFKSWDQQMIHLTIEAALRQHALGQENEQLSRKLDQARSEIKTLNGLLPICSGCKKIQDQKGYWTRFEVYIEKHSAATFIHGICPDCRQELQTEVERQMPGNSNRPAGPRF